MTRKKRFISLFAFILIVLLGFLSTAFAEEKKESKITLRTDFWISEEGYRQGENIVISSSLNLGPRVLKSNEGLSLSQFDLVFEYKSGEKVSISLYDDGKDIHRDIKASDGLYTNSHIFEDLGEANATFIASGKYKNESFLIKNSIGEIDVKKPGNIILSFDPKYNSKKYKNRVNIPINIKNESEFKEKIYFNIDDSFGELEINDFTLKPNSSLDIDFSFNLDDKLSKGLYDLKVDIRAKNELTKINKEELNFKIEKIGFFESIYVKVTDNPIYIYGVLIFACLLLLIHFIGILFYMVLVKRNLKLKGTLSYKLKKNPNESNVLALKPIKKSKIKISFDEDKDADFYIKSSLFDYSINLMSSLDSDKSPFILGWKALLLRKADISYTAIAKRPGILEQKGRENTSINLYGDDTFSSGEYIFDLKLKKSIWLKKEKEGKNLLEDKI